MTGAGFSRSAELDEHRWNPHELMRRSEITRSVSSGGARVDYRTCYLAPMRRMVPVAPVFVLAPPSLGLGGCPLHRGHSCGFCVLRGRRGRPRVGGGGARCGPFPAAAVRDLDQPRPLGRMRPSHGLNGNRPSRSSVSSSGMRSDRRSSTSTVPVPCRHGASTISGQYQ